jgi:quinol-cytochrome oxidoreductase complex cytochrome b subunit
MYGIHVLLLPTVVVALVVAHVLLVRKHGVVPPFKLAKELPALEEPVEPKTPVTSGTEGSS